VKKKKLRIKTCNPKEPWGKPKTKKHCVILAFIRGEPMGGFMIYIQQSAQAECDRRNKKGEGGVEK